MAWTEPRLAPTALAGKDRIELCRDLVESMRALDRAISKVESLLMSPLQPEECGQAEDTLDGLRELRTRVFDMAVWVFPSDEGD